MAKKKHLSDYSKDEVFDIVRGLNISWHGYEGQNFFKHIRSFVNYKKINIPTFSGFIGRPVDLNLFDFNLIDREIHECIFEKWFHMTRSAIRGGFELETINIFIDSKSVAYYLKQLNHEATEKRFFDSMNIVIQLVKDFTPYPYLGEKYSLDYYDYLVKIKVFKKELNDSLLNFVNEVKTELGKPTFSEPYYQYLQTDHWQIVKRQSLARANFQCEMCGTAKNLEVHHITYKNIGNESPEELVVLCERCHGEVHKNDLKEKEDAISN